MIYKKAWISKYFNVDVKSEEGIVFLYDNSPTKKTILVSDRFEVLLEIPDVSKQFFQPNPFWNDISSSWIESSMLSDIQGGFQSYNARGTKTEIYSPPFLLPSKCRESLQTTCLLSTIRKPMQKQLSFACYNMMKKKMVFELNILQSYFYSIIKTYVSAKS